MDALNARHAQEQQALDVQLASKQQAATKKTRKGIIAECDFLARELLDRHARERASFLAPANDDDAKAEAPAAEPATTPVPTIPTVTPPTRKPNRQKARLERRAAAAEAAASLAASEAATQPDLRATERAAMRAALAARQLREHAIPPDGHCLYASIADQLCGLGVQRREGYYSALDLRLLAAEYILQQRDEFAGFVEGGLEAYVEGVRGCEWGGEVEILALARALDLTVKVVQVGRVESVGAGKGEVWLAYYRHAYGLGEHYNSLRRVVGGKEGGGSIDGEEEEEAKVT
ncbi:MAG: hypothetical protein M1829_002251 [Trizodia sp. TS-e1964]|nr:MAG: hypothetical protein M1829_002251 [Trizodia sp. TS-e1964]